MRVRRLGSLSAGLVIGALGLGSTACADQNVAARVGDETVTEEELYDELDELAPLVQGQTEGRMRDSYSQEFAGGVLQQRVLTMLFEQTLAEEGIEVTDDDRARMRQQIEGSQSSQAFAELSDWYQDVVVQDEAVITKMTELPEDEVVQAIHDVADRTEIEIGDRFGSWDPDQLDAVLAGQGRGILAPEGPLQAGSGEGRAAAGPAAE